MPTSPTSFEPLLAKASLFQGIKPEELRKFAGRVQLHRYEPGQTITRQGELGTGLYVIIQGSVNVIHDQGEPSETQIATLGEGDFFGDMALLRERTRSATIVAREATECVTLVRWDFKELALESPDLLWNMLETLADRLADADESVAHHL